MADYYKNEEAVREELLTALIIENKKTDREESSPTLQTKTSNSIIAKMLTKLK